MRTKVVIGALILLSVAIVAISEAQGGGKNLEAKTLLWVGTQDNCNNGIVTTNELHLNCTNRKLGYTIDDASATPVADFVEVMKGVTPGKNDGFVSPDANHKSGATQSIGFLSKKPIKGGIKLNKGTVPNCNDGEVTPNNLHKNCTTEFLGYALPM